MDKSVAHLRDRLALICFLSIECELIVSESFVVYRFSLEGINALRSRAVHYSNKYLRVGLVLYCAVSGMDDECQNVRPDAKISSRVWSCLD